MRRWLFIFVVLLAASALANVPEPRFISPTARFTFASSNNFTLNNGSNGFTIVAQNIYGAFITNNLAVNLTATNTLLLDLNGNLTNDGTRNFSFDAENRLTNVTVPGSWKSDFVLDGFGRRRIIRDFGWQGGAWVQTNETRYIFDGLLPIQERDTNNNVQVTYTRGLDFSDSLNGAGGIGGLLARTDANGTTFYHSDGNGNITALMDGNQYMVARYLWDPYGRMLGKWGPLADGNVMRFSSMPVHRQSGLSMYPLRDGYEPNFQRWIQRDPIGEAGGINLYGFVGNCPLNSIDPLGLDHYQEPGFTKPLTDAGPMVSDLANAILGSGQYFKDENTALRDLARDLVGENHGTYKMPDGRELPVLGGTPPLPGEAAIGNLIKSRWWNKLKNFLKKCPQEKLPIPTRTPPPIFSGPTPAERALAERAKKVVLSPLEEMELRRQGIIPINEVPSGGIYFPVRDAPPPGGLKQSMAH